MAIGTIQSHQRKSSSCNLYYFADPKVAGADLFRVGSIGHITDSDVAGLIDAVRRALAKMGVAMAPAGVPA